jgi:alkanesulfonate monooxygenase SsuD/methylene tetrahydromethanopterin reductase-like flavin-dependent oxidoreductase (luciferase family)
LRLGTGICLLVERDPITTAKAAATLDYLSDGRLLLGVGGGWNFEEMQWSSTAFGPGQSPSTARTRRCSSAGTGQE